MRFVSRKDRHLAVNASKTQAQPPKDCFFESSKHGRHMNRFLAFSIDIFFGGAFVQSSTEKEWFVINSVDESVGC